jgi:hypothetical protein
MEISYFNFERTIPTLVEISQSNLEGGISALIPLNCLWNNKSHLLLFKSTITDFILSKYRSKIFILNYYIG